jgi:hypothetical protein
MVAVEGAVAVVVNLCAWMLVKTTDTIKHPTEGYDMKWCKLCGPGHHKGTPQGMYIHAPHDHKQWLLNKQEKDAKFEGKKKSSKPSKTKADDGIKSPTKENDNKKKRLKLSDTVVNGLTTEIMLGDSNARVLAKKWFARANAHDSSDDLVKIRPGTGF